MEMGSRPAAPAGDVLRGHADAQRRGPGDAGDLANAQEPPRSHGRAPEGRPAVTAHRPARSVRVRALLLLGVVAAARLVGDGARDRLWAAFRFGPPITAADARLDAWVTPPAYTAQAAGPAGGRRARRHSARRRRRQAARGAGEQRHHRPLQRQGRGRNSSSTSSPTAAPRSARLQRCRRRPPRPTASRQQRAASRRQPRSPRSASR